MSDTFNMTSLVVPESPAKVVRKDDTPSMGISVINVPLPSNPSPVDMIRPDAFIIPATSRGALGEPKPMPTLPLSITIIRSKLFVRNTRLLVSDSNIELVDVKSKSILLLLRVIIIILCIYKKKYNLTTATDGLRR